MGGFILIAAIIVGSSFYTGQKQQLIEHHRNDIYNHLMQAVTLLRQPIAGMKNDTLLLSRLGAAQVLKAGRCMMQGLSQLPTAASICPAREALATAFESLLRTHPEYVQIRLIGLAHDGREILRLDQREHQVTRTPEDELQAKGDRSYVAATMALREGEVYLSALELNQEHGQIEIPHKPIMRVSTPLFDEEGRPFGLIIINVAFDQILAQLDRITTRPFELYLTTPQGHILHGADFAEDFGHELGQPHNVLDRMPQLKPWLAQPSPVFFSHAPELVGAVLFTPAEDQEQSRMAIIIRQPMDALLAALQKQLAFSILIVAILLFTGLLLSSWLARRVAANLRQLTLATSRFALGDANTPLPKSGSLEIIQLADAFEGMRNEASQRDSTLRDKETYLRTIIETSTDGIITTDQLGLIHSVNPTAERMFGYDSEELVGQNVKLLMPSTDAARHDQLMNRHSTEKGLKPLIRRTVLGSRKDGSTFPIAIGLAPFEIKGQHMYAAFIQDITELQAAEEAIRQAREIENLAFFDPLTHLPNRRRLRERLEKMIHAARKEHQKIALAVLDLDGFKNVNDRLGHEAGDQLLQVIGRRLRDAVRGGDIVARLGGDEFAIALSNVQSREALERPLNMILQSMQEDVPLKEGTVQVSASIGITLFPEDADNIDLLMRQADIAMYRAKAKGRSRFIFFTPDMEADILRRHTLGVRLQNALESDEFELYYQPQVQLESGAVTGAEALIRWNDPEHGLRGPGDFIPLAEESDLIIRIGRWVIKDALRQIETWNGMNMRLEISVNVAARQLQNEGFVSTLRDLLAAHPGVAPRQLKLEITETAAMQDFDHVSEIIRACGKLGVGFSLDDFGTGYSSLTYLQRLPVESIKIDRSFVQDLLTDANDAAITKGIIDIAQLLKLTVIAEGVEGDQLINRLIQYGCLVGQGYGIARPMPASQLADWVSQWQRPAHWTPHVETPSDTVHFSLNFAMQAHEDWLHTLVEWVHDGREAQPPVHLHTDASACHFGRWSSGLGAQLYSHNPLLTQIRDIHLEIHTRADEIVKMMQERRTEEARKRIPGMFVLRDRLFDALNRLEQARH